MKATPMAKRAPPPDHRFGPANPGRRGGRPKGARNVRTIIRMFVRQKHLITIGGRRRRVSTTELLLRMTAQLSIESVAADKLLEQIRKRFTPDGADQAEVGVLVVSEDLDMAEWDRRQTILNKFRKPPSTLADAHESDEE
jgi:hypothetical protein